ncbi:hypothetical protein [Chitinophaga sp. Ak27]|uniref:hypothetical protein n=1 Tax=Chitinophaga sp. Ak27 TaxID=2726116 RepID=UPI00145D73F9|nr:hypothetical protein [Chitinophaga sp. Ak27]NLU96288.1 hypothetical protein [Chitinophaga sp. Ak27]
MMKIEQFRQARADDLRNAARVLEKELGVNTSPIYIAAEALKNETPKLKDGTTNGNFWGYEISDLIIPVDTVKHVRPKGVDGGKVELSLNMKLIADYTVWDNLNDPMLELNFNVSVRGLSSSGSHYFCLHIDRHDLSLHADEPHPVYHLQYTTNPKRDEGFDYGHTLFLDTPRIIHHPVDFILGIGFLTTNFFPLAFDQIMDDGYFLSLYKRYQEKIMQPYFQTLASHWNYSAQNVIWKTSTSLCPSLL